MRFRGKEMDSKAEKKAKRKVLLKRYRALYLFILIPILYFIVYHYVPIILQIILSFKDYSIKKGLFGSEWVGLQNFRDIFSAPQFTRLIRNTVVISVLRLMFGFLPPIILAILLYDMGSSKFRKASQTVLYIPHFFSWVVIYAISYALFSSNGYINNVIEAVGGSRADFLMDSKWFYPLLIGTGIWKDVGWGTIIYMAALSNIDPELFDAAKVDGAGPLQRIRYITFPSILPIVVFLLTISIGQVLNNTGMEQILLFYSPATYNVADVIDTWVYRVGFGEMRYSMGAALSLFKSVIGLILILVCNKIAIKTSGRGIW